MSTRLLSIPVDGGLTRDGALDALPENASPSGWNFEPIVGGFKASKGMVRHSARPGTAAGGATELAVFAHEDDAVDARLFARCGSKVYATTNAACTFDGTEIEFATTTHDTNRVRFAQFENSMFAVDGANYVKRMLGFSTVDVTWTTPNDFAGGIGNGNGEYGYGYGPTGIAYDADDQVWVCDPGNQRVQEFDASGTFVADYDGSGGGGSPGACLQHPVAVAVDASYVYVLNTELGSGVRGAYAVVVLERTGANKGNFVTQWGSWTFALSTTAYALTDCRGIAISGSTLVLTGRVRSKSSATVYTSASHAYTVGNAVVYEQAAYQCTTGHTSAPGIEPGTVGGAAYWTAVPWTDDAYRPLHFSVTTGTGSLQAIVGSAGSGTGEFSGAGSVTVDGSTWYLLDRALGRVETYTVAGVTWTRSGGFTCPATAATLSGLLVANETVYVGFLDGILTFTTGGTRLSTVGVSGTGLGQFRRVRGLAKDGTSLYVTDSYNYRVQLGAESSSTDETAVWELGPLPTLTAAPGVAFTTGGTDFVPYGTWEVCCTLVRHEYDTDFESNPSPSTSYTVQVNGDEFVVTPNLSGGGADGDVVRCYVRDGNIYGDFTLVAETTISSGTVTPFSLTYDPESALGNLGILPTSPQGRPPREATILLNDGDGRLVAAVGNRVYFSNVNDPMVWPDEWFDETPADAGGWIELPTPSPITGISVFGSVLVVFTQRAMFRLSRELSLANYGLDEVVRGIGCLSHETIQQTEAGLWWFDGVTVWAWQGSGLPERVGIPIEHLLAIYQSSSSGDRVTACYDVQQRRYIMLLPNSDIWSATPGYSAKYLAYDFRMRAWTNPLVASALNIMPRGYLLYASALPTEGLYATDYALNIMRLFSGGKQMGSDGVTGYAYPVQRDTRAFRFPGAHFGSIRRVTLYYRGQDANQSFTLTLAYNNQTVTDTSGALTGSNLAGGIGRLRWTPPLRSMAADFTVTVSWNENRVADPTTEIRGIDIEWTPRGRY